MSDYEDALNGWLSRAKPETTLKEDDDLFSGKRDPELAGALARVKDWVRQRFVLADEAAIMVSEVACNLPGCPPLETAVAFWEGETRHHFKMFKQAKEVTEEDLPYAWMKESLIVPEGFDCECC